MSEAMLSPYSLVRGLTTFMSGTRRGVGHKPCQFRHKVCQGSDIKVVNHRTLLPRDSLRGGQAVDNRPKRGLRSRETHKSEGHIESTKGCRAES